MARKKKLGAGYRQRSDGRIEYRWTGEDGKRYSVSALTLEVCERKVTEKKQEILKNSYVSNRNITLEGYFSEWQKGREGTVRDTTQQTQKYLFRRVIDFMGDVKVCKIERRQVQLLQDYLKSELATKSVNSTVDLLKSVLTTAVNDGIIDKNPASGVKSLKRTEKPARDTIHRALTLDETQRFFTAASARESWYLELYDFLINTGCRVGEAAALKRSDIDFAHNVIHIRRTVTKTSAGVEIGNGPKTSSSKRDIPMTEAVKRIILRQEQKNRDFFGIDIIGLDSIIFRSRDGNIANASNVGSDIKKILRDTDIEPFTPHAFRDTFATRAIESGMNPQTLKEILGHGSFAMTMDLYAHVMEDTKRREMQLIQIHTGT